MSHDGRDGAFPPSQPIGDSPKRRRRAILTGAVVSALLLGSMTAAYAFGTAATPPPVATPAAEERVVSDPAIPSPPVGEDRLPVAEQPREAPPRDSEMTPVPVLPVDLETIEIPDECVDLYSASMFEYLSVDEELPLNDGTTLDPPFSKIAPVAALQEGLPGLACTWGSAGHFGLLTQVNEVSAEQADAAEQTLRAVGFACEDRDGGTRCVTSDTEEGEAWGETHFLRGNVWLCTFWANIAPRGYTSDMVDALWG